MKPTNCSTMISGPGVVSAMPRPSSISPRLHPVIMLDRLLRDIGQHRIGAAEGHQRHLAEEQRDLAEDIAPGRGRSGGRDRHQPEQQPDRGDRERPRGMLGRAWSGSSSPSRLRPSALCLAAAMPPRAANCGRPARAPTKPITPAPMMMTGNGTPKKKIATKAIAGERDHERGSSARACRSRTTASITIASTAAFSPKNSASTTPTLPKARVDHSSAP